MDTMELIGLARSGDKLARERLIKGNMGLVYSVVRRFSNRGYETEDLCQIGAIGLIKAIDKFDLNYEVRFSTYAVPMIAGEIKRFLRDDGIIKVSRSVKETAAKVAQAKERLQKQLGREPTVREISEYIRIEPEEIAMAMDAACEVESLNKTIYQGDGNPISLMDKIEERRDAQGDVVNRLALSKVLETLGKKEREIIYYRYYLEKTQTDIAKKLGISQVQVSRLERKILNSMREKLS